MRYLSLAAVSITSLLLSGCVIGDFGSSERFSEDFHYSYDLQPGGRVLAETYNGRVEISGWDENKVDISGTKYGSTERMRDAVKIETHNSPLLVEIRAIRPSTSMGSSGARLVIHVPKAALVERVATSNGSVTLERVGGVAHVKSSNGSIRVEDASGDLDARTSNARIEVEGFKGNVSLRTSNGRITGTNLTGKCEAETSNSSINIRLQDAPTTPVRLTSSNGAIELALAEAPKGDIRAETSNGSITVHLPGNTAARVNADTSNASVSSEFDLLTQFSGERSKKDHMSGSIGTGGPSIDLTTRNGRISILKTAGN